MVCRKRTCIYSRRRIFALIGIWEIIKASEGTEGASERQKQQDEPLKSLLKSRLYLAIEVPQL
jgi:hypothetical protein